LKTASTGSLVFFNTGTPDNRSGTISTTLHSDQSINGQHFLFDLKFFHHLLPHRSGGQIASFGLGVFVIPTVAMEQIGTTPSRTIPFHIEILYPKTKIAR